MPLAAHAAPADYAPGAISSTVPAQLDAEQRAGYRAVFQSIRDQRWQDAQLQLDAMKPGPLHTIARAEMLTAKGSPKADLDPLVRLLAEAPELPQAQQVATLAASRGAVGLPPLPFAHALTWIDGAPTRGRARAIKSDLVGAELALGMQAFIKADDGASAQALLESTPNLSPEALTEWQQKVAWMYFLSGDDNNARAMANKASLGVGDWAVQGNWVGALSAWRQHDCAAAGTGFEAVTSRASDIELRAAGLYWASRADMACGRPDRVEARLKTAAQYRETFYGLLAREALGIKDAPRRAADSFLAGDWQSLARRPNIRVAAALVEVGETNLADQVIRQQAKIGDPSEYPSLIRFTEALSLPSTLVWLSHYGPAGASPPVEARFPAPNWSPDGGWRVDRALVFAHTLQESSFRTDVVSTAGAYGLMQVRPVAAADIARKQGRPFDRSSLSRPGTNFEVGQSYLEQLRDQPFTGGLLPKVIAAYNAGPTPVSLWNTQVRDGGDPLLYIESIPYWETRGYVTTVLRNYWMYEAQTGRTASPSRVALSQGLWPRFPGLPGATSVRLSANNPAAAVASAN
uniref:lytic transglycosylase domain-containing protein n=1 Tax=Sphingomonas bacterium TaxID=1895847 RepID=UPI00260D4674|nr:lytic transglycosylase domain-containing protein [Sphingomonas bacterium]